MLHQAIRLKYLLYGQFIPPASLIFRLLQVSLSLFLSRCLPFLALARSSIPLSISRSSREHVSSSLSSPTCQPRHAFFLSSFLRNSLPTLHLYTLSFFSTLIFLCRLRRSRPTIRQRIKAACVRRYLRPLTPSRLLISSRGSKNTPLRPCVLSRARRGHRGYPSAGVATTGHSWG